MIVMIMTFTRKCVFKLCTYAKLKLFGIELFWHLTVRKQKAILKKAKLNPMKILSKWVNSALLLTNPSARAGYDTRSIFNFSLNSEFFSKTSCLTKAEELSLPSYLPIAGWRIIGFIPFPRVLVQCEMQSVSFRIWTRVAVFISYDDNHYTTN